MRKLYLATLAIGLLFSCTKNDISTDNGTYFPPLSGNTWQTVSPDSLKWNKDAVTDLLSFLEGQNTRSFIILKSGKIAVEKYYGSFTADSAWGWASASKTLTAIMAGIAQQEGKLNPDDKTSKVLGAGWTSAPREKEDLITIRQQMSMTTGLKPAGADEDCTLPSCLAYEADAGTKWRYQNATYSLLENVITKATGKPFETYFQEKLGGRIGMKGYWNKLTDFLDVYYSDTRSMARFGLMLLRNGKWSGTQVIDPSILGTMTSSSQNLNPSYGLLTWLNGKSSYMYPGPSQVFNGSIVPSAPADMFYAWGKNQQKIYVVPSLDLVVVRFAAPTGAINDDPAFDAQLWSKIMNIYSK